MSAEQPQDTPLQVVILGAGVIGLSTAHVLSTRYPSYKITVVARDLPDEAGLLSQAWASPWAGADWSPIGDYDERRYKMELKTFNTLWDMLPTGLVRTLDSRICFAEPVDVGKLWYKDLPRDFRVLKTEELPAGLAAGVSFTTVSLNPQIYLPWLYHGLRARGVHFVRRKFESIAEAAEYFNGNGKGVVVNATALGARTLIGVEDQDVFPIRGQTILASVPNMHQFLSYPLGAGPCAITLSIGIWEIPTGHATYMIPRPSPEGHVLIGGTFQVGNWDLSVNHDTGKGIWQRASEIEPALKDERTRIISHNVGLRPARKGGPRIEAEWFKLPLQTDLLTKPRGSQTPQDLLVVHAYGFGAAGYQGSWGAAEEVVDILQASVQPNA
ncbi:FAD dependent oxidoreductase [Irpex rosettiformis]|uniref:FAD dependent oxidoreductase n=1 Tax=Irpex rosettiformis TaxID=378272 RepID=A0ACB8UL64_9APHY|nr:FAD dependent oxidoreductase [Irpex rosettiformis]